MRKLLKGTINKDLEIEGSNEDCVFIDLQNNRALMVDGASESFAARRWARILVNEWKKEKEAPGILFIEKAQTRYSNSKIENNLNWAIAAAAARGSFCTFLEVKFDDPRSTLSIRAVGDTCVILVSENIRRVWSFPIDRNEDFNSSPLAISTFVSLNPQHHNDLLLGSFSINWQRIGAKYLIMATDAVAHWLIVDDETLEFERIKQILDLSSPSEFRDLVVRERSSKSMHIDDSTIAVFDLLQDWK